MKFLTQSEAEKWVKERDCPYVLTGELEDVFPFRFSFEIPDLTGRKTAISTAISHFMKADAEGVLDIPEWGVWDSCTNYDIFYRYRRTLGEDALLIDKHFHVFDGSEIEQVRSLAGLCLYFYFDARILSGNRDIFFWLSHDEYIQVFTKEQQLQTEALKWLVMPEDRDKVRFS